MPKRKNHTGHNATKKDHKNGIKKAFNHKARSLNGMNPKTLRNLRFAKRGNKATKKAE
jgi:large subunit ribosomal protein L29e